MSRRDGELTQPGRRRFLTAAAATGATSLLRPAAATPPIGTQPSAHLPSAIPPSARVTAAEVGTIPSRPAALGTAGSDFMTDVIKSLNIEYVAANPASSLRGLHESLIDYGQNKRPEFLTCTHEENAVALAHGYFKITGKPLIVMCHGTVGLQHACMAVYNAWCDRVPVVLINGNALDAAKRPPGVATFHAAQDVNALIRDFTKWDNSPVSLQHFAQSFIRAFKIATTPPYGPVAIALDTGLQEEIIQEFKQSYHP